MPNTFTFGAAPTVKRGSKSAVVNKTIPITGLRDLKALRRLRAAIVSLETEIDITAKAEMMQQFVETGCNLKVRPENFTGIDEGQSANCQLRARSFGPNGVSEEQAAEIEAVAETAGIGSVIQEIETFEFNPEVLADSTYRAAIEKALGSIPGLPADFIQRKVKRTLDSKAMDRLFAAKAEDAEFIETTLPLLSTLAIRVDYDKTDTDLGPDLDRATKLFAQSKFGAVIQFAMTDVDAVLNPRSSSKSSGNGKSRSKKN